MTPQASSVSGHNVTLPDSMLADSLDTSHAGVLKSLRSLLCRDWLNVDCNGGSGKVDQ